MSSILPASLLFMFSYKLNCLTDANTRKKDHIKKAYETSTELRESAATLLEYCTKRQVRAVYSLP